MDDTTLSIDLKLLIPELEALRAQIRIARGETTSALVQENARAVLRKVRDAPTQAGVDLDDQESHRGWLATRWPEDEGGETILAWIDEGEDSCVLVGTLVGGQFEGAISISGSQSLSQTDFPEGGLLISSQDEESYGTLKNRLEDRIKNATEKSIGALHSTPSGADWLCPSCGFPNDENRKTCTECGHIHAGGPPAPLKPAPSATVDRSAAAAARETSAPGLAENLGRDLAKEVAGEVVEEVVEGAVEKAIKSKLGAKKTAETGTLHTCVKCQKQIKPEARFCVHCGTPQPAGCPHCGHANKAGARFCTECGKPLI